MKKILSLIMPVTLAALFAFADTAGAVVNDGNSNLQHYQNAYQVEALEGGGGGGGGTTTTCGPGQYRSGSSCLSCGPGTYKTGVNTNTSCTACPAGTYRSGTGGTSASSCTSCPSGTVSAAGSTSSSACTSTSLGISGDCPSGTHKSGNACINDITVSMDQSCLLDYAAAISY